VNAIIAVRSAVVHHLRRSRKETRYLYHEPIFQQSRTTAIANYPRRLLHGVDEASCENQAEGYRLNFHGVISFSLSESQRNEI
jgi:hypothetical protein